MSRSVCLILAGLALIAVAQSAAGCSIMIGPKEKLTGEASILDVASGMETKFQFDGVGIGSDCSATNRMQVSGSQIALAIDSKVEIRDLAGRSVGAVDLGEAGGAWLSARFFRLDSGLVYFPDEGSGKVVRVETPSGNRRDVIGIQADQLTGFTAEDGLISWTSGADSPRLTVYDQASSTFVVRDKTVLAAVFDPYYDHAELLGIYSGEAYILLSKGYQASNAREVHAVGIFSNESRLAADLSKWYDPSPAFHRGELAVRDDGAFTIQDLRTNTTRRVEVQFAGDNVDYDGTTLVFDGWIVVKEPPLIPTTGPGFLLLAVASVVAVAGIVIPTSIWLARQRKKEKRGDLSGAAKRRSPGE